MIAATMYDVNVHDVIEIPDYEGVRRYLIEAIHYGTVDQEDVARLRVIDGQQFTDQTLDGVSYVPLPILRAALSSV
jgi:hypothetical protein